MERDLYYVIEDNGYHIYDRNNSLFHVHQYEPFIPNKNLSYEENAKAQIAEMMIQPTEDVDIILDELEKEVGING